MTNLDNIFVRRSKVHKAIVKALGRYSQEAALEIVLNWISIDDLEKHVAPVITKGEWKAG